MHSINACKVDVAAQIMYEECHLNETYPFQSTTSASLKSFLVVLATAQRDLQEYYTGQPLIRENNTYNVRIACLLVQDPWSVHVSEWFDRSIRVILHTGDVKATQSGREGEHAYKIGKIFDMKSHDQETEGIKGRQTKDGPRMARLQTIVSVLPSHIILLTWLTSNIAVKRHCGGRGFTMISCMI
jgi:hypothetical protein